MSEYANLNSEAIDAQQEYEAERQEVSGGVQVNMTTDRQPASTQVNVEHVPQQQPKARPRNGWKLKEGSTDFYLFPDFDLLFAEYKQFLKREVTPKGEGIIHIDPQDGQTYKFGVSQHRDGTLGVWSKKWDPNRQSSSSSYSGGGRKSFYLDVGLKEVSETEANALLAASEGDYAYRYKLGGSFVINQVLNASDGTKSVITKIVHVVLKQKRIEY